MSGHHRLAPSPEVLRQWRIVRWLLALLVAAVGVGSWWLVASASTTSKPPAPPVGHASPSTSSARTAATPAPKVTTQSSGPLLSTSDPGGLTPGSDPRVLPGPLLIADEGNNRLLIIDPNGRTLWEFPRPGDLSLGETFKAPDDAYFTPDGKQIIATQGDDNAIRVIDVATRRIVYTYGRTGVPGSGPNQVSGPDDAMMLPNGDIIDHDIKSCRIIMIPKGAHAVSRQLGHTGTCAHHPPQTLGNPSGVFPMASGNYLISEIRGSWVTEMSLSGRVAWSARLPSVAYLSNAVELGRDRYLAVDFSSPGQALTFDHKGRVLWRYAPTGELALNTPSTAIPLPDGYFMISDKANHRILVVDPTTKAVVWQYGQIRAAGAGSGYLNNPGSLDLYPPNSLLVKHAATMGKVPR